MLGAQRGCRQNVLRQMSFRRGASDPGSWKSSANLRGPLALVALPRTVPSYRPQGRGRVVGQDLHKKRVLSQKRLAQHGQRVRGSVGGDSRVGHGRWAVRSPITEGWGYSGTSRRASSSQCHLRTSSTTRVTGVLRFRLPRKQGRSS